MAIRAGYSVGRNTGESSLVDQLKRYKPRVLAEAELSRQRQEDANKKILKAKSPNISHETLKEKCIKVIVDNFARLPVRDVISPDIMRTITDALPTSLPHVLGAKYIYDENYWKRCCVEKYGWHKCQLAEHGALWKQLYFEKLFQEKLEDFDASTDDVDDLFTLIAASQDYIFSVTFKQLPIHLYVSDILSPEQLPNLTKVDISYGVNKIGMNYERMLFGMKISDATSLAKTFQRTDTLTTLLLSGNMIDDDLLRMLMTGLIKNNTITHLDVSHNKITNHGARLLSKLLGENSVVTTLNLADNQIHAEGGRYLARGLRENDSLLELNLRLNRLTDDGCRLLMEGMQDNPSLTALNISCNGAAGLVRFRFIVGLLLILLIMFLCVQTSQVLMGLLMDRDHHLEVLDISGNELTSENMEHLLLALSRNKKLSSLDLRRNPGYNESKSLIPRMNICVLSRHNVSFLYV
jgi:hypothetical protein